MQLPTIFQVPTTHRRVYWCGSQELLLKDATEFGMVSSSEMTLLFQKGNTAKWVYFCGFCTKLYVFLIPRGLLLTVPVCRRERVVWWSFMSKAGEMKVCLECGLVFLKTEDTFYIVVQIEYQCGKEFSNSCYLNCSENFQGA